MKKKTVFVVDDESDITELVSALLKKNGFEVETFNSADQGLKRMKAVKPDLLLLDMRMPGMTGPDLYDKIMEDKNMSDLKIIFFSATTEFDTHLLKKKNIIGFIPKPFDIDDFVKKVNKYLK